MANDPHRSMQLPSLRYWVHLVAPGWNVIGAGEPALPGVSVGHNERGAWGFTIFPIDQEDLYVYETDPADPSRYRYRDGWEVMKTFARNDRGQGTAGGRRRAEVHAARAGRCTRICDHHRAYALRAAWLEEGTAPYLASLRLDQAASWAEFREACRFFLTPSENMVWADVDGHIGWQAVGLAPRRKNWNGLLPVPGDGRYEWDGYLPILELPHVADPPRGWIASANQDNLPSRLPVRGRLRVDRPISVRPDRGSPRLGPAIHVDGYDAVAARRTCRCRPGRSCRYCVGSSRPRPQIAQAIDQLLSWDFVLSQDSVPAAIYVAWEHALKPRSGPSSLPKEARGIFPQRSLSTEKLIGG